MPERSGGGTLKYFHDQERRVDLILQPRLPEKSGRGSKFPSCLAKAGEELAVQRRGVRLKNRQLFNSEGNNQTQTNNITQSSWSECVGARLGLGAAATERKRQNLLFLGRLQL